MSFTSRLVNYKRKEVISGRNKTTFFTEVNTDVKVGDKVFIANGNYDTHDLIVQDEYNPNASGYKVLKVNGCSVTLDIEWSDDSITPFSEISSDDCIKIWTVSCQREFDYYKDILVDMYSTNKKFTDGYGNYIYTIATVSNGTYSLSQGSYWSTTASMWNQVSMIPPKIQSYQSSLTYNQVSDYPVLPIPIDRTLLSYTSSPTTPPGSSVTTGKSGYIHGKYLMNIGDTYRLSVSVQESGILNNGSSNILEIWQGQDISNKNSISTVLFDQLNGIVNFQVDFLSTNSYIYLNRDVIGDKYIIKLNCDDFFGSVDNYGRDDGYVITLVNSFGSHTYTTSGLSDTTFLDDFILFEYLPQLASSPIATFYDITTENLGSTSSTIVFTAKFLTLTGDGRDPILSATHSGIMNGGQGYFYTESIGDGFTILDFKLEKREGVITNKNLEKLIVIGDKYTNNTTNFHQGPVYKHNGTKWIIDKQYTPSILGKSSFRNGYFQSGVWSDGLYGTYDSKIIWEGLGQWRSGMFLNATVKGLIGSKTDTNSEQKTVYSKFENSVLQQSTDFTNNKGYGYNYLIDSDYIKGTIDNGNFIGGSILGTMNTRPVKWYYQLEPASDPNSPIYVIMDGFTSSVTVKSGNFRDTYLESSVIERSTLNNIKATDLYVSYSNIFNSDIINSVSNDSTFDSNSEIKISDIEMDIVSVGTQSYRNIKMYADWDKIKNLKFGRKIYLENINLTNDFKVNNIDFSKNYLYMDSSSLGIDYSISIKSPIENASINMKASVDITVASSSTIYPSSIFNSYIRTGYFDGVFNGTYKGNWINDRDFILKSATVSYNITHTSTSSLNLTLATYSGKNTWWDNKLVVGDIVKLDTINYLYSATQSYSIEGAFEVMSITSSSRTLTLSPIGFALPNVYGGTFSYNIRTDEFENISSITMIFNDVLGIGDNDQFSISFGTYSYPFVFKTTPILSNHILLNPGYYDPFFFDWVSIGVKPVIESYLSEFYSVQDSTYDINISSLESGQQFNLGITFSLGTQSALVSANKQDVYNDTLITYHGLSKINYVNSNTQNGRFARIGAKWTTFDINSKVYNLTFNDRNYNLSNQAEINTSVFDKVSNKINRTKVSNSLINDSILSNSIFSDIYWTGGTISNSNINNSSYNKQNEIFLSKQINSFWSGGQSINSTFSTVYWHDGSFNGGLFTNGTWRTGNWYDGKFGNPNNKSDSNVFLFGNWINGYFYNSTFGSDTNTTLPWGDNAGVVFEGSGTISGVTGSDILSGIGTLFTRIKPGYLLRLDNKIVSVVSISSNTQLSVDTTWSKTILQNSYQSIKPTNWYSGNFESGTFRGRNNTDRELIPNTIWHNGIWKNGTFVGNGIWKNGTFLGGKFLSVYGTGTSSNIIDFAWQNGMFKGGQFGDSKVTRRDYIKFPSKLTFNNIVADNYILNSSWYDGVFDGGVWNGNVWSNGTFSNGTFDGRPSDASITLNDGRRTTNKINLSLNSNFIAKSDITDRSNWKQKYNLVINSPPFFIESLVNYIVGPVSTDNFWYYGATGGVVIDQTSDQFGFVDLYQSDIFQPGINYDIEITYKSSDFKNISDIYGYTSSYPNFRIGPGYESLVNQFFAIDPNLPSGKQLILRNTNGQIVTDKIYGVTVSSPVDLVVSANGVKSTIYNINVYESVINNYPNVANNLIMNHTFSNNSNWVGYSGYNINQTMIIPTGATALLGATNSFWYLDGNNGVKLQLNTSIPIGTTFSLYQDLPITIGKYYDIELTYNNRAGAGFKGANNAYSFTVDLGDDNRSYSIVPQTNGTISTILIENRYASSTRVRFTVRRSSSFGDWLQLKEIQLRERVATWKDGAVIPSSLTSQVELKNLRWQDGDFNHNKGKIIDGIWYDGTFRNGEWTSGIFNPYSKKTIDNGINVLIDPKFKNNKGDWKVSTSGTIAASGLTPVTGTSSIYNWKITSRGIEKTYNATSWYLEQRNVVEYGKFYNITIIAAGSGAFHIKLGDIIASSIQTVTVSNVEQVFSFGLTAKSGGLGLKQFVILPGSFNGYIKEIRMVYGNDTSDTYNLDDTCYWENGTFNSGEFNISEFKNGLVKNGNFTSAIVKYATWLYGNAYNLVWEDGRWRNGNWYGAGINLIDSDINNSTGIIENNMIRQQLLNPMRYYSTLGLTSSNDIFYWNMFGWKTLLTDSFDNNNNGWLTQGNATITDGNLVINTSSIRIGNHAILSNVCKIGSLYRITITYTNTSSVSNSARLSIGSPNDVYAQLEVSASPITRTYELECVSTNSFHISNNGRQSASGRLTVQTVTIEEFQYTNYNNVGYQSSTQSFTFNLPLQTPPGTTSSVYSNKRNSPLYGQMGNGNFISGQWEYGNWMSGKRYDTKSIELSTLPIISWGKIFKNKSSFVEYVQNQWFIILKSNSIIASNYKVGDKITIGNITYIDINDNRKYISLTTISAINSTQFTILFESPFLIKSVEQDNTNIPVRITKNNWVGGVFLNGIFDNGVWVNGYVKGLPGVTRMTNTLWLDGKFDGGYFGEGNSIMQNTYLRLNTSTSSNNYTFSTVFFTAKQSFLTQVNVPYDYELSNIYDIYDKTAASTVGTSRVLSSTVETKLSGNTTYLSLGSKWKKYYSVVGNDSEFIKQGEWNVATGASSGITYNIDNGFITFDSSNSTSASASLYFTYSLPDARYQVAEFSITGIIGSSTSLSTAQRGYSTLGEFREFYYNKDNLKYTINKDIETPGVLSIDYIRLYETDMVPFYRYFNGTSSFYYNPIKPYTYSSPYIDFSGNNDLITYTWDTYFLPDNTILYNR